MSYSLAACMHASGVPEAAWGWPSGRRCRGVSVRNELGTRSPSCVHGFIQDRFCTKTLILKFINLVFVRIRSGFCEPDSGTAPASCGLHLGHSGITSERNTSTSAGRSASRVWSRFDRRSSASPRTVPAWHWITQRIHPAVPLWLDQHFTVWRLSRASVTVGPGSGSQRSMRVWHGVQLLPGLKGGNESSRHAGGWVWLSGQTGQARPIACRSPRSARAALPRQAREGDHLPMPCLLDAHRRGNRLHRPRTPRPAALRPVRGG